MESAELEKSPWAKIAAIIGGAGATAVVSSQVQKAFPQASAEMAGGGAGFLLYLWGGRLHELLRYLGIGLMAGSLMPRVGGLLGGSIPTTTPPPSTTGTGSSAALALAKAYAGAY